MSTLIILSSSPPRDFARSPTPADLSCSSSPSGLPSPGAILRSESSRRNKFKNAPTTRDKFSAVGFSTARQVLAVKQGAENKTLSPGRTKFRLSQNQSQGQDDAGGDGEVCDIRVDDLLGCDSFRRPFDALAALKISATDVDVTGQAVDTTTRNLNDEGLNEPAKPSVVKITASDAKRRKPRSASPLLLKKVTAPRHNRTTPNLPTAHGVLEAENVAFPVGISDDLNHADEMQAFTKHDIDTVPAKRRKLDLADMEQQQSRMIQRITLPVTKAKMTKKPTAKRSRSPAKKALTITALATSKFQNQTLLDEATDSQTQMTKFLSSTQAELQNITPNADVLQTQVIKTKAAAKKLRNSRSRPKSRLVSPTSAMRVFEQQEAIFGSASQLARDESPDLLRDTIEATKQSEFSLPDVLSSPQNTQTFSLDAITPQATTSKFRRSRNLWAAAGRDEDNALLHMEVVDLSDSPIVRDAFAGKDVMVQPSLLRTRSNPNPLAGGGFLPLTMPRQGPLIDIDDVVTPAQGFSLHKALHTAVRARSPVQAPVIAGNEAATVSVTAPSISGPEVAALPVNTVRTKEKPKNAPKKPHYAGLTDQQLQKQISAYGFKAIKKREKMVELLERCWVEKHGHLEPLPQPALPSSEPETAKLAYGDILSNVHDILARPEPKTKAKAKPKTPRARKKKDDIEGGKETPVKKPRQRKKKAETTGDDTAPSEKKAARKRVTKAKKPLTEETVQDVDDIVDDDGKLVEKVLQVEQMGSAVRATTKSTTTTTTTKSAKKRPEKDILVSDVELVHDNSSAVGSGVSLVQTLDRQEGETGTSAPKKKTKAVNKKATPTATSSLTRKTAPTLDPSASASASTTPKSTPKTTSDLQDQDQDNFLPSLLDQISQAIHHESQNPQPGDRNHQENPTWHEKILLYDPITLEDLATWLNTTGLHAVHEDREVSALDVRTWCEQRGICCLWKGGWRGNRGVGIKDIGGGDD